MKYAIPSYRRRNILEQQTIQMLIDQKVDFKNVDVFVSDEQDLKEYKNLEERYGLTVIYKRELKDIVEKFNFIHCYYPKGTRVVLIEDDIEQLAIKVGENQLKKFLDLSYLAEKMFNSCDENKTKLWGISPYANAFYMKDQYYVGFKFIVANLFGFIATNDSFLAVSQVCKSDYERTLLYFIKFGCVVRMDGVCAITKNYKNSGGLQNLTDRARLEAEACHNLVRRFGHLVSINQEKSQKSMYMELKLKQVRGNKFFDWMSIQKKIDTEIIKCKLQSEGILGQR